MKNVFLYLFVLITAYLSVSPVYSNNFDLKFDKILNSDHRSQVNKGRDKFRNPKQTLSFSV